MPSDASTPSNLINQAHRLEPKTPLADGDYVVVEALRAQGGQAAVYLARDVKLDRLVVLKVFLDRADGAAVVRFRREARIAAKLGGLKGQVPLYRMCESEGILFSVMELVQEARPLPIRDPSLPVQDRLRLLLEAARLVETIHRRGVVHRDLKPENLLLDGNGRVFLIDFGLAKELDEPISAGAGLTTVGSVFGTARYMSPEQWDMARNPAQVREPTDIFALGIMLHELLTGGHPAGDPEPGKDPRSHFNAYVDAHRQRFAIAEPPPGTPTRLHRLLERATAVEPTARCSASEFCSDLAASLESPASSRGADGARGVLQTLALAGLVGLAAFLGSWSRPAQVAADPTGESTGSAHAIADAVHARIAGSIAAPTSLEVAAAVLASQPSGGLHPQFARAVAEEVWSVRDRSRVSRRFQVSIDRLRVCSGDKPVANTSFVNHDLEFSARLNQRDLFGEVVSKVEFVRDGNFWVAEGAGRWRGVATILPEDPALTVSLDARMRSTEPWPSKLARWPIDLFPSSQGCPLRPTELTDRWRQDLGVFQATRACQNSDGHRLEVDFAIQEVN